MYHKKELMKKQDKNLEWQIFLYDGRKIGYIVFFNAIKMDFKGTVHLLYIFKNVQHN